MNPEQINNANESDSAPASIPNITQTTHVSETQSTTSGEKSHISGTTVAGSGVSQWLGSSTPSAPIFQPVWSPHTDGSADENAENTVDCTQSAHVGKKSLSASQYPHQAGVAASASATGVFIGGNTTNASFVSGVGTIASNGIPGADGFTHGPNFSSVAGHSTAPLATVSPTDSVRVHPSPKVPVAIGMPTGEAKSMEDIVEERKTNKNNSTKSFQVRGVGMAENMARPLRASVAPFKLSEKSKLYLGKRVPKNTTRNNAVSLRALCHFVVSRFTDLNVSDMTATEVSEAAHAFMFPSVDGGFLPAGTTDFLAPQLEHVRDILIEFVTNYRHTKTGAELKCTTIKTYITSIQRAFKQDWGYNISLLSGPVFDCPRNGLLSVLDNKIRELQRSGDHVVSHTVLSRDEVIYLFQSESLSTETAIGLQARLVFAIGILTAMRPTALWTLSTSQFSRRCFDGKECIVISGAVGATNGSSKTHRGGWKSVGEKLLEVVVYNETYHGSINFFELLDFYLKLWEELDPATDRFFLTVNLLATNPRDFFKRTPVGRNKFMKIVKDVCAREGIQGSGSRNWVTTHGLRGTLATILFGAGHADSSVALRTGHRDPTSLKSYQHLRGQEGLQQQRDLLNVPGSFTSERVVPLPCASTPGMPLLDEKKPMKEHAPTDGREGRSVMGGGGGSAGAGSAGGPSHDSDGTSKQGQADVPPTSTNSAPRPADGGSSAGSSDGATGGSAPRSEDGGSSAGSSGGATGGSSSGGSGGGINDDSVRQALSNIGTVNGGTVNVTLNYYLPREK